MTCDAAKENAFLQDLCHEMGTTQKVVQMNAHESKVHPELWVKPPIRCHLDNAACSAFNHQLNVCSGAQVGVPWKWLSISVTQLA